MSKYTTTLNAIKSHDPCPKGWRTLLKHLNKKIADDEPLDFEVILESNGLDDAIWALRALPDSCKTEIRLLACDFAESVVHLVPENETRPAKAIKVARLHAKGQATDRELRAAWAATAACTAASDATWAAAWAAAWETNGAMVYARDASDATSVQKVFVNWLNSRKDLL